MIPGSNLLTRRKAIQGAVALLGGTVAATQLGPLVSRVEAMDDTSLPLFFSSDQLAMVERIVDLIIPETDTPGAKSAGVHRFIDMMLAEWASPETQAHYVDGLKGIEKRAGNDFLSSSASKQMELLETLDAEAFADDARDTFFKDLKRFVLFGYYSSEEGASVELKFDRLPGLYRECVPFDEIGRSWST